MERTKQLVWSAFKTPFGRRDSQQSNWYDDAAATSASPPPYSEAIPSSSTAPNRYEPAIDAYHTPVSQHAKPSAQFPTELPPRPQRESIFTLNRKQKGPTTAGNNTQAPLSPLTPPLSPGSEAAPFLNPACNHDLTFFTPPTSPILDNSSRQYSGSTQISHTPQQDTVPSPPYSVEDPLSAHSPCIGRKPLSRKAVFLRTSGSNPSFPSESSSPVPDRLADRFANLRVGTGAPTATPRSDLDSLPSQCENDDSQPDQSRMRQLPKINPTASMDLLIRRRPVPGASQPCASSSQTSNMEQTSPLERRRQFSQGEDENPSPSPRQTNQNRRGSRPTYQVQDSPPPVPVHRYLPGRTAIGTFHQRGLRESSRSPQSDDDLEYPDLAAALARSVAEVAKLPTLPTTRRKTEHISKCAITVEEERDRNLAEALQREEDKRYDKFLTSISVADYDEDRVPMETLFDLIHRTERRSSAHRLRRGNPIAPISGRRNARYFRSGTKHNPIQLSSDGSDPDIEMGEDSIEEGAGHQRVDTVDRTKIRLRVTAINLECAVCSETVPTSDVPYLDNCTHEPQTCGDCFAAWIESELEKKGWQSIKCPGSNCRVILAHDEVQKYATREVFEQYDSFAMRAALGKDPRFRWCRAPNCNSGQIHLNGEDGNIFRCVACGHRVCVIHNDTFHEGETCQEFDYRTSGGKERDQRAQEEASENAVKSLSKVCIAQDHFRARTDLLFRNAQGKAVSSISRRMRAATI
jgi:hypothetical protein